MPAQGGLRFLSSDGAIKPTGTCLGASAGDFVFRRRHARHRSGEQCDPRQRGREERIRQAFTNTKVITESEDASLASRVRLTVFVTNMKRLRPLVNKIQEQLWASGPYPPRTILKVAKLNQDNIFEMEWTFFAPA
jgi:2-iminobutanoate/2-iminopropanoate deaminase